MTDTHFSPPDASAHTHSPQTTGSLLAAVVQLDFQPAYVDRIDYLSEPIWTITASQSSPSLFDLEERLLERDDAYSRRVQIALSAWRKNLRLSYEAWFSKKLTLILDYLKTKGVDLIVLPEYSVPCGVLPSILSVAKNRCLVAGSHIVTSDCADSCAMIGVQFRDNGQAVAPIFRPDGGVTTIHKLGQSRYETSRVRGTEWTPLDLSWKGHSYRLLVQLCVDFIDDENETIRSARAEAKNSQLTTLHVVPALTPILDDFRQKAINLAKRKDEIVLFANSAAPGGGSGIFFVDSRNERQGSALAEEGEELITIVEIAPHLKSRTGPPTLIPTPAPAISQLVQTPIHYWGIDELDTTLDILKNKNWAAVRRHFRQEVLSFPDSPSNKTLNRKLRDLKHRIGTLSNEEIERLSEFLSLPPEIPTMNEWRCNALYASAQFLENQAGTSLSQTAELCRSSAIRLREIAAQLLSGLRLGFTPEQISKHVEPGDLLKRDLQIAGRISSVPSSGRVESGFISWLKAALAADQDPRTIEHVVRLIDTIRSHSLDRIRGLYDAFDGADATTKEKLIKVCSDYEASRELSREGLGKQAREKRLVQSGQHILIFGFSTSILAVLEAIASEGAAEVISVTVAECKNRMGVDSAWDQIKRLTALGFPCKFVAIEALGRHLLADKVQRVLLGAKFITHEGVVNTMGSLGVTTLARISGSNVTVVASRRKLIPDESWNRSRSEILEMQRPYDRVTPANWAENMIDVRLINYAYDLVDFHLIDEILTEDGIFKTDDAGVRQLFISANHNGA